MYTWTFDSNAWLIKAYIWLWKGDKDSINFCKLFWGTIFAPFALFAKPWAAIFGPTINKLGEWSDSVEAKHKAERPEKERRREAKKKAKEARGPNGFQRTLTNIGTFFDKVAAFAQNHEKALQFTAVSAGVIGGLAALALIGYGLSQVEDWEAVLLAVARLLAFVAAAVVAVVAIVVLFAYGIGPERWAKIKNGFKIVGAFLKEGGRSVKYRTCPNVVVK